MISAHSFVDSKKQVSISIVIPVYNNEDYLCECVESILNQSFKDFELILVDDGSKDSSPEICDSYSAKDARVKVVHQQNAGVSVARNTGISHAAGEYLCFVDSDDTLPSMSLELLWQQVAMHPGVDVVCGQIRNANSLYSPSNDVCDYTDDKSYIRNKTLWDLLNFSACGRLVKRELIIKNKVFFTSGITCGEDQLWVYSLHKYLSSVAQCRNVVYEYRVNTESVMHQEDKTRNYVSTLRCAQQAATCYGPDGERIECAFILDRLSIVRLKYAWIACNQTLVRNEITATYLLLKKLKIPFKLKYAAWRLTLPFSLASNRLFDFVSNIIIKL